MLASNLRGVCNFLGGMRSKPGGIVHRARWISLAALGALLTVAGPFASAGTKVILLESTSRVGGFSAISGGSPVFAGTDFLITVSGDLLRSNAYIFAHNGILGYTTSKKIKLPANWRNLIREVE